MSDNVYDYHNRERISLPAIESIKKIDLNDFRKSIEGKSSNKYLDHFMLLCSRNVNDRYRDINEEDNDDLLNNIDRDNVDISALSEDKQRIGAFKLEKLYEEYPNENWDITEYPKSENDDDNNIERKKIQ